VLDSIARVLASPGGRAILKALASPGGAKLLGDLAEQIVEGRSTYRREHWGREPPNGARAIELPPYQPPIVLLGALGKVGYATQKGPESEPTFYTHTFNVPVPMLYHDRSGELVIVRHRSKYKVRTGGIVG
jgi:hypothetical protein